MRKAFSLSLTLSLALVGAALVVPISHLSLEQRRHTLADSTLVSLGTRTVTLGKLRAAHHARELFFTKAAGAGTTVKQQQPAHLVTLHAGINVGHMLKTPAPAPPFKAGHGLSPGSLVTPTPTPGIKLNLSGLSKIGVLEPPSQYASAPGDMKAFCQNAWASACLFLPPGQQGLFALPQRSDIVNFDPLVDQAQCTTEGGTWIGAGCNFFYPRSYTAHFTPPANDQLPSSVQCDPSIWSYNIDVHGAILVSVKPELISESNWFNTGQTPWCVIHVYPGS